VVNQFTIVDGRNKRRPDLVLFVNGVALASDRAEECGDRKRHHYRRLQPASDLIENRFPSLFRTNAVLVTSDGVEARIGSLTADQERFMPWRTVTGEDFAHRGTPELETLLRGVFTRGELPGPDPRLHRVR